MPYSNLTTLADVRAWLQTGTQPYPSTDDAFLLRLITAASQLVQSWLNRPILSADWQETRDGLGTWDPEPSFVFAVQPVSAVIQVVVDLMTIPPVSSFIPAPPGQAAVIATGSPYGPAGYVFTPTMLTIRGYSVPRRRACVQLQYTAGFASVPFDVAQATIELVARKYRERTRIGERSKSLGGGETTAYETTTFSYRDLASDIQLLLQQYRQVAPIAAAATMMAPTATDPAMLVAAA